MLHRSERSERRRQPHVIGRRHPIANDPSRCSGGLPFPSRDLRRHSVFAPLPGGTKLTPLGFALTLLRLAKGLLVFLSLAVVFVAVIRVRMQNREN